ncbi:MAG: cell division ATP-binding protein FtsE [Clostridia bacterium]|nr:cell division ATP-binding protein FtsE [Clostridia bacterium]
MIQFLNVSKIYSGGNKALVDVSFRIEKGEFVFIVGPSGAGKTTLIKLLMREEQPSKGQVLLEGKNIGRLKPSEVPWVRRRMGVVFQDFRLLEDRTVFENVALAMEVVGASPGEIRRRVPEVLGQVGLGDKLGAYPVQLSGGEQQRAAIARAIVNRPGLVVADEPTGNLDPGISQEVIDLLVDVNKSGTTVIVATHAQALVNAMRKRVLTLNRGRLIRDEERGLYRLEA